VQHRTWESIMEELIGHYYSVTQGMSFAYRAVAS